jgi:hypothetical protein
MTTLSDWLELFYLQAVLPEQNYIILLPTIKSSATPEFLIVCGATSSVARSNTISLFFCEICAIFALNRGAIFLKVHIFLRQMPVFHKIEIH